MGGQAAGQRRTFTWNAAGRTLFAAETGEGWPVVMLHGGMAEHRALGVYLPAPPAKVRLITPDVRGSGRSVDPGPLSWEQLADDVASLLDHLGIDRAVVGGASLGTVPALAFALRHPERTAGAVFVHPVHAGGEPGSALAGALHAMHAAAGRAVDEGIEALRPLYAQLPEQVRERAWSVAREFDPASCLASTTLYLDSDLPPVRTADLRAVTAPTLVVPGADPMHPAEVGEAYAAAIPGAGRAAADQPLDVSITRFCRRVFG